MSVTETESCGKRRLYFRSHSMKITERKKSVLDVSFDKLEH